MNQVTVDDGLVAKRFTDPVAYEHEVSFHRDYQWATPPVVKLLPEKLTVVAERGSPVEHPNGVVDDLAWLIVKLAKSNVHHRDIHPGNIVVCDGSVRLIDWETATHHPGISYDLFGPIDVPVPVQHGGLLPQWWMSNDHGSIYNRWGIVPPDWVLSELHS